MICQDKRTAESIETFAMNKEEKNRYFNNKALKNKEQLIKEGRDLDFGFEGLNQQSIGAQNSEDSDESESQTNMFGSNSSLFALNSSAVNNGNGIDYKDGQNQDDSYEMLTDEQKRRELYYFDENK